MFRWRSVPVLMAASPILLVCVALLSFAGTEGLCLLKADSAIQNERLLQAGFRDEVDSVRKLLAETERENDDLRARLQVADRDITLLRVGAPNLVLPGMDEAAIRSCALQILEIYDLGADETGMGYSITTILDASGRCSSYALKVDEGKLNTATKLALRAVRIILKKKQEEIAAP